MNRSNAEGSSFGVRLTGLRDIPTRFAFSTLVGGIRFWTGFVVGVPLVFLLATGIHELFIPIAAGAPVAICLWFLWISHEFINPELTVNVSDRELVLSKPYSSGDYSPINADDLRHISIIRFPDVALVRLHYPSRAVFRPLSTAVTGSSVSELKTQLERIGIDVTVEGYDRRTFRTDPKLIRVVGSPVVLVSSVLSVWLLHGTEAFFSNVVVVPAIVLLLFAVYGNSGGIESRSKSQESQPI